MGHSQSRQDVSVVVVGGGFAGIQLARGIASACNVTLIDSSPFLHQSLASLRTVVLPGWSDMVLLDREGHSRELKQVRGKVTGFNKEEKTVTVEGVEEAVKYDYLVLATGSQCAFPAKVPVDVLAKGKEEIVRAYDECRERLCAAKRISIVGGGAVGVELAAEIAVEHPDKEVTLIHSYDSLLADDMPMKMRRGVQQKLDALGVRLVLGQKVDLSSVVESLSDHALNSVSIPGPVTLSTDKNEQIEADLVFPCIGVFPNKGAYSGSLSAEQIDEKGYVKVDEFLQVQGEENIFAIGDCNNRPVPKMALHCTDQAVYLISMMKALLNGKPKKVYQCSHTKPTMVVPIGRIDGIGMYHGSALPTFVCKKMKAHDLLTGKLCGDFGVRPAPTYPKLPAVPARANKSAQAAPAAEDQPASTEQPAAAAAADAAAETTEQPVAATEEPAA
eukprot:scpid79401/ scgid24988/ Apoptosis-inducing factor 2